MQNTLNRMSAAVFPRVRLPYVTFAAALLCGAIAVFSAISLEAAGPKRPYTSKNVSTIYQQNVNSGYLSRELIQISERSYEPGEIVEYDFPSIQSVPKAARVSVEKLPEASDGKLVSGTSLPPKPLSASRQDLSDIYGLRPEEKSATLASKSPVVRQKASARQAVLTTIVTDDKYVNPWAPKAAATKPIRQSASLENERIETDLFEEALEGASEDAPSFAEDLSAEAVTVAPAAPTAISASVATTHQVPSPLTAPQSGLPNGVVTVPLQIQVSSLPSGGVVLQTASADASSNASVNALEVPKFSGTITRTVSSNDLRRDSKAAIETADLLPPEGMDPSMPLNEIRLNFDPHVTDLSVQNIKWLREFAKKARQSDLPMVEVRISSLRPEMQSARYDMVLRTLTNNGLYEEQIRPIITERHPDSFVVSLAKSGQASVLKAANLDSVYSESDDPYATVW